MKYIIFDFDGTIGDSQSLIVKTLQDTMKAMGKLRITTADSGPGIITAARNLLKAGARENKKKKTLAELETATFIDNDSSQLLIEENTGNSI